MSDPRTKDGPVSTPAVWSNPSDLGPVAEEFRFSLPFGLGAVLAALASLATCYASIITSYVLGLQKFVVNPHFQAVLMWGLALLAVAFLWRERKRHNRMLPLVFGGFAVLTLIMTLYFNYDERIEALAYILLVIGALLNQVFLLDKLNRTVLTQAQKIDALNQNLENEVTRQEHEISRLGRLKQFLAPQVAELVVAEGTDTLLDTHRRYIACLFCDIRNFTAFSEAVEPEDVIMILQAFHDRIGSLISDHGGTIGYRSGDGVMVFFNDPIPCDQPVLKAVRLSLDIMAAFEDVRGSSQKLGHEIGLGIGISSGHATLGLVGFQGRSDYTAIGGVVNTASRLCDLAEDKQVLISRRAHLDIEGEVQVEAFGQFDLKGISNPLEIFSVLHVAASNDRGAQTVP